MNAATKIEVPRNVYGKIAAVQAELAKTGISKSRRNQQQGYNFRGIDEVYDALAPLLAEHKLCILPRMVSRQVVERQSAKGGALFNVTVEAEFDFVSAEDGSTHIVRTFGEAMDSADKATNKAMSAAYKYAALMTFAIPTEGDNDADATTHEVASRQGEAGGHSRQDAVNPPPADGPITDEQVVKLQSLIRATSTDIGALMLHLKAPENARLIDMPQRIFPQAVEVLEQRLAEIAKAQTAAKAKTDFGKELDDAINF